MKRYRAVVLDLFGTVVHFRGRPDPAFGWLRQAVAEVCPGLDFDGFRRALIDVSVDLNRQRHPEHLEVSSRERFRRALARAGGDEGGAEALSLAHMRHLAGLTTVPAGQAEVLAALAAGHRLGLVSNFDHGPTAIDVLARHGLQMHFEVTVISADFGRRKPHPAIFGAALASLECLPSQALYVGDTHAEDVVGARAAGMDVAWIAAPQAPAADPAPTWRIASLADLPPLLAG